MFWLDPNASPFSSLKPERHTVVQRALYFCALGIWGAVILPFTWCIWVTTHRSLHKGCRHMVAYLTQARALVQSQAPTHNTPPRVWVQKMWLLRMRCSLMCGHLNKNSKGFTAIWSFPFEFSFRFCQGKGLLLLIRKSQMPVHSVLSSFVTERILSGFKVWFETACVAVVYGWDISLSSEKNYFKWKKISWGKMCACCQFCSINCWKYQASVAHCAKFSFSVWLSTEDLKDIVLHWSASTQHCSVKSRLSCKRKSGRAGRDKWGLKDPTGTTSTI